MLRLFFILITSFIFGQNIRSIQLFNPQTNDETPVIKFGEQLILRFDDLDNGSQMYRYTIKHLDRNWQDDGLFFTEYATGNLNAVIDDFKYSFNTYQPYTHYTLTFPNKDIQPKISGNFEIIVYKDSPRNPLFTKRFSISENMANIGVKVSRYVNARTPHLNQRIEIQANGGSFSQNIGTISLNIIQNNNFGAGIFNIKPSSSLIAGSQILFQQQNLLFAGNNEFSYFDNKNLNAPMDMVQGYEQKDGQNYTYLFPTWTSPFSYQYQPDVNGAFYFRSNNMGQERNADYEADYSWVVFALDSLPLQGKNLYVLGQFNDYKANEESRMHYDETSQKYYAKIYLKQGFYNYILATKDEQGKLNLGEINGNFWQTQNQYQAFLYYRPFGKNYDALMGYGEIR
ncbi:MAG: DUF5103 domain-containing protein [Flavobacteriaceae bacterium]|nr:DUF5103 domain-containing protein [Flavobacteriaceae bacterium]